MTEMKVIYTNQDLTTTFSKSIFLAGPTPREKGVASWRPDALKFLEESGYDGVVFVPESTDKKWKKDYTDQVDWEDKYLNMSDCILFWVPRELKHMPALTTNDEWGFWKNSGKVVFGAPNDAVKVRYQKHYAEKFSVPNNNTLEETVKAALVMVGDGARREDGEREVPLYIWNTPSFQNWYRAQRRAGNILDGARVEWTFRVGPEKNIVFIWAIHARIYVTSEKRYKINEVVLSRPDISSILLYRRGTCCADAEIVLVREFRSPASTADGYIRELPGGSSWKPGTDPVSIAVEEVYEETGLRLDTDRLSVHESRQLAGTMSAHKTNLFSSEISADEMDFLRSQKGIAHGEEGSSERTFVEIRKLKEILSDELVDWSTIGMISSILIKSQQI